jgi:RHS repeat-associated protein
MIGSRARKGCLTLAIAGVCVLAAWNPATFVSLAYASTKPLPPAPLAVSDNPIEAGAGDLGYLAGSGEVSPQGQYTYSIPIDVPAGRAGMQPSLSLTYSSASGNGVLGVGWSLSGTSSISRCTQTLSTDGQVQGVHLTDSTASGSSSDRFCLDGKKLVAISGTYGQIGAEYRTEEDSYVKVASSLAPSNVARAANEPQFTVQTKSGRTLTYTALYGNPMETALLGPDSTTGTYKTAAGAQAIVSWALASETDAAGNGVQYIYCAVTASSSTCPVTAASPLIAVASPPDWLSHYATMMQWELNTIVYTTASSKNGGIGPGYRMVKFSYENLPKGVLPDYRFQAGVATGVFQRLTKIAMWAPNPSAVSPVWQYDIGYVNSSFSKRSLLSTVKRCALNTGKDPNGGVEGGCTWKKEFFPTTGTLAASVPQWGSWQTVATFGVGGLNAQADSSPNNPFLDPLCVWAGPDAGDCYGGDAPPYASTWLDNPPVVRVLDADGDGHDDVLFQPGGPGGPRDFLLTAPAAGPVSTPLSVIHDAQSAGQLQNTADPASQGDRQALQNVYALDIDGDGSSEVYVTQAKITGTSASPDFLGNDVTCQSKVLHWGGDGVGFVDVGLNLPAYECRNALNARQWNMFLDLDGDGRLDHLQAQTIPWAGNPLPGQSSFQWVPGTTTRTWLPSYWQTSQMNTSVGTQPQLQVLPNLKGDYVAIDFPGQTYVVDNVMDRGNFAGCPSYVVDFTGDGRGQLFGQPGVAIAEFYDDDPTMRGASMTAGFELCGATGGPIISGISGNGLSEIATYMSSLPTLTTTLQTYDQTNNVWNSAQDTTPTHSSGEVGNPKWPIMLASTFGGSSAAIPNASPSIRNTAPALIFGDFNGDGLEDVIEPDQDPANNGKGILWLRWNTGNGFGPRIAIPDTGWAIGEANVSLPSASSYQVFVTDINHDGRADLVIYHKYPFPAISLMLSNGDGTFSSMDLPNDKDPGIQTFDGLWTGAIGDFNGDGYTDLLRLEGTNQSQGASYPGAKPISSTTANLQVLSQLPVIADKLQSVFDEQTVWPREAVTYSVQWSDKPEPVTSCAYPRRCQRRGSVVVREVDYRGTLSDISPSTASLPAHSIYYSYEDSVADMRGRGSLGFRKVRIWDPTRLSQTITEYDNRTEAEVMPIYSHTGQNYYPGATRPKTITSVTLIPSPAAPQTAPTLPRESGAVSANARVMQTQFTYVASASNGGLTYVVHPQLQVTSDWEQTVSVTADVLSAADPTSDYLWNPAAPYSIVAPNSPLRVATNRFGGPNVCNNGAPAGGIDAYGNVLQSESFVSGGVSTLNCATYELPNTATWQVGLLQSSSTTVTENGGASVKRGTSYDYDGTTSLLAHVYQHEYLSASDNSPSTISTTTMSRDGYGNVTSIATQAMGPDGQMATRQTNIEYDALWPNQPDERIFASQHWSPTSYPGTSVLPSSWRLIHPAYGVLVQTIDVNGVQATNTYDDQGRLVKSIVDGHAPTIASYAGRPEEYGGQNGMIEQITNAGQVKTESTDADGRMLGTTHLGFDGTSTNGNIPLIFDTYVKYDLLGRPVALSRPYPASIETNWPPIAAWPIPPPPNWPQTSTTYDSLDRRLTITAPDSSAAQPVKTTVTPTFFTTTTQDPNGNQGRVTRDVNGRLTNSANLLAGVWIGTQYTYAPFNQLAQVIDPRSNVESMSYDSLGRPTRTLNPDTGLTSDIVYDGFGELLSSTHQQSGAKTVHSYDVLGREAGWKTVDGAVTTSAVYTYDSQLYGLGKLATATSSDNVTTIAHYDVYGRSTAMDEIVAGHTYSIGRIFNSLGQMSQVDYPAIANGTTPGIELPYTYTATGNLSEVSYIENGSAVSPLPPLWRVAARNLDDALVQGEFGNNVTVSKGTAGKFQAGVIVQNTYLQANGRLQQMLATPTVGTFPILDLSYGYYPNGMVQTRTDLSVPGSAREETYTYDSLNRLTGWDLQICVSPACTSPWSSTQEPLYAYSYDDTGNLEESSTLVNIVGWKYVGLQNNTYGGDAGPHALTTQNVNGTSAQYSYDSHGRQTSGAGRSIVYNAYDLPKTLSSSGNTWTLLYDAFGNRVQKSGPDGTTIYVGGLYEKRTTNAGVLDVFHVPGGELQYNETNQTTSLYGEFTDVLGSVGTVFNSSTGAFTGSPGTPGTTVDTFFYDPFGARITANGEALTGTGGAITKGFTGQVYDEDWGLINFRGRLYNPTLKRFMSADPHVTSPGFSQSWNPYSYVNNSPPNLTDPTGFDETDGSGPTPDQAAAAVAALPGNAQATSGVYALYDDAGFVAWQVNLSGGGYLVFQGYAPPTDIAGSSGPAQSTDAGFISPNAASADSARSSEPMFGPPTEEQWAKEETEKTLNRFSDVAMYSPTLAKAIQLLRENHVIVVTGGLPDGLAGQTFTKESFIRINDADPSVAAGILTHEANHLIQYWSDLNQEDPNHFNGRTAFILTRLDNEIESESRCFEVNAELIHAGVLTGDQVLYPSSSSFTRELYLYAASIPVGVPLDRNRVSELAWKGAQGELQLGTEDGKFYEAMYGKFWDFNFQ